MVQPPAEGPQDSRDEGALGEGAGGAGEEAAAARDSPFMCMIYGVGKARVAFTCVNNGLLPRTY